MTSLIKHINTAKRIVNVMDLRFNVLGIRFGIDPLLDLIPGLGNVLGVSVSLYLFWIAWRLRVPTHVYLKMFWNIGVDYLFGVLPVVGFFMDVFFRSNVRNFALIEKFADPGVEMGEVIN